ncbi:42450_t:CDS:2 [Gigaspora margarita]|uniref:42450_t:CDS:1 n=1 Tax=Gigaspora margarita TaxID=4874 RepID=A0ABN7UAS8_GIGMA|nr:42450_t:CDS:2 [Gigaspora margarita]
MSTISQIIRVYVFKTKYFTVFIPTKTSKRLFINWTVRKE